MKKTLNSYKFEAAQTKEENEKLLLENSNFRSEVSNFEKGERIPEMSLEELENLE